MLVYLQKRTKRPKKRYYQVVGIKDLLIECNNLKLNKPGVEVDWTTLIQKYSIREQNLNNVEQEEEEEEEDDDDDDDDGDDDDETNDDDDDGVEKDEGEDDNEDNDSDKRILDKDDDDKKEET